MFKNLLLLMFFILTSFVMKNYLFTKIWNKLTLVFIK